MKYNFNMQKRRKIISWAIVLMGPIILLAVKGDMPRLLEMVHVRYEDISFALLPSADKAFAFGEAHFDAETPATYDIDRAEHFFVEAVSLDPKLPYLYHELARISFLRGNNARALALINLQIAAQGDNTPNSYYVRGLIEGYMGNYADSSRDYERFLQFDPNNWAAINDYSWVLLKSNRPQDAADALARGLSLFPDNPWLLNSYATALYELGQFRGALEAAAHARNAALHISRADWLHAYPGNDPHIAEEGISTLQKSTEDNIHTIELALVSGKVQ